MTVRPDASDRATRRAGRTAASIMGVTAIFLLYSCTEPEPPPQLVFAGDGIGVFKEGEFRFVVREGDELIDTITTAERVWHHSTIPDVGGEQVMILKEHAGGNICQSFSYRLVVTRPATRPRVTERFGSCAKLAVVPADGRVLFEFSSFFSSHAAERAGRREPARTWEYRAGRLSERKSSD